MSKHTKTPKGADRRRSSSACSPGSIILARLEQFGVAQNETAERMGIDKKTLNLIANDKAPISPKVALDFERVLFLDAKELLYAQADWNLKNLRENDQGHRPDDETT